MRLRVFQSDKGDCLLLTSKDGKRVLIDGGMGGSYRAHVAPTLARIRANGDQLDLVYVSHIDRDHIQGILRLMEDLVDWRVHDFQAEAGNDHHRPPKSPRPPEVADIWHNAFRELADDNDGKIEELLAASAMVLEPSEAEDDRRLAQAQRELATSVGDGIELSRRVSAEQLGIPLNRHFDGLLALVREGQKPINLGSLKITVIGPFQEDLDALRDEWNAWLKKNQKTLRGIQARMRRDVERLATESPRAFRAALAQRAGEIGDRDEVTAPNLASLMLVVDEGDCSVLLTGDGHADEVLRGLERAGRLDKNGGIVVDVLKVQHHGAEFNTTHDFCRRVTARHYVFCGNGEHGNPDPRVVEAFLDSRLGTEEQRSKNPGANGRFKLWFNSSEAANERTENRAVMRELEKLVSSRAAASGGRLKYAFLADHFVDIRL